MYKLFKAVLTIIWVIDILNFPCVYFLDTSIPINFLGWCLIWWFIPDESGFKINISKKD